MWCISSPPPLWARVKRSLPALAPLPQAIVGTVPAFAPSLQAADMLENLVFLPIGELRLLFQLSVKEYWAAKAVSSLVVKALLFVFAESRLIFTTRLLGGAEGLPPN